MKPIVTGSEVRVPRREGDVSGLVRYGKVKFVDGRFVRVTLRYGQKIHSDNTYTVDELEREADNHRERLAHQRRLRRQR